MSNKLAEENKEVIARRMGYNGPMTKFHEFLAARNMPQMNEGGLITNTSTTTTTSNTYEEAQELLQQQSKKDFQDVADIYTWQPPEIQSPQVAVSPITESPQEFINQASGQLPDTAPTTQQQQATPAQSEKPEDIQAQIVEAVKAGADINELLQKYQFATGTLSQDSTVRGQYAKLMQDFEEGKTPAWATGAIRSANTAMAQRGISASTMAGQAIIQATMESALPIAQQDAAANLQMQMANLNNEQQMLVQKNQSRMEAFFSDVATENATRQFNAANQNQIKQFNSNLRTQVNQFNTAQTNAMREFNAGQGNAMSMFRAQMEDQRQQFNAQNRLIIDQANAKWRQQISTSNNATTNEANRINAQALLATTMADANNWAQSRRDAVNFAYSASESAKDRAIQLLMTQISSNEAAAARNQASKDAMWGAIGSFAAKMFF